jgi:hypothetical protein
MSIPTTSSGQSPPSLVEELVFGRARLRISQILKITNSMLLLLKTSIVLRLNLVTPTSTQTALFDLDLEVRHPAVPR